MSLDDGSRNTSTTPRLRLRGMDYSQPGSYFVTCVAINREMIFGQVRGSIFEPSILGAEILAEWLALGGTTPTVVPEYSQLMPDHFHGMITLLSVESAETPTLSAVIGRFKSLSARRYWQIRDNGDCPNVGTTCWQGRYHDVVIRNDRHYQEVVNYMALNPHRWSQRNSS